ncbi:MAG: hypothetical protein LH616_15285, partial [Ilumatobacteraceae bacterium]|nr:hypothetical protein [Ilumatobacteraceae bacterium]
MKRTRGLAAVIAAGALLIAACSDDKTTDSTTAPSTGDTAAVETTIATGETTVETVADTTPVTEPAAEGWAVDTDICVDPDTATAPIEGTVKIGSAM